MTSNPLLDNLSRMMTGAMGVAEGMKKEADGLVRAQFERMLRDMDVVTREEFEAVKEMAARARDDNDALTARIEALEALLAKKK
ncbi:MAG TPA: accessory factor UbiK family protein [Beijerinckiaceae bacterium]|mgnify:CR=1 FL=1|nr:accessory factor UbiK family protein [Beijerinckiaceae bacterium]